MLSSTTREILRNRFRHHHTPSDLSETDEQNICDIHEMNASDTLAASREIGLTEENLTAMRSNISRAINSP